VLSSPAESLHGWHLAFLGIGEQVTFHEQPAGLGDPLFIDMPGGQPVGHRQAGGMVRSAIGRDQAKASAVVSPTMTGCPSRCRVPGNSDFVEEAVAIVADAADEGALPASCDRAITEVGDGTAADEPWLAIVKALKQVALLCRFDEAHGAALEAELRELGIGHFQEDVHDGVAQAADVNSFIGNLGKVGRCGQCRYYFRQAEVAAMVRVSASG